MKPIQIKTDSEKTSGLRILSGRLDSKWWVLFTVGIGTFMSALDGSVVNTVLPEVARSFNSSIAGIEWVITVYLLMLSGLLLSFGRLGDMRGHKRVYVSGFLIFLLSSALCGLAPSVGWLVSFRAVQALGAAMLSANSPAILTKSFPARQRGQALGIQATMTYLGLTVGPSFGGWLASQFSWRAVFYINMPVGLFALWASLRFIPTDQVTEGGERFDLAGAGIFMVGLVALLLGLNQGYTWGWTSLPIMALLAAALVLLGLFLRTEARVSNPMLDLGLFRNRLFSLSVSSAILNYICVYSVIFLMPFYLIRGLSLNPAEAGLVLTAQPVVMAIVAPISGTLSDKIGSRVPGTVGMGLLALGLFLLSRLGAATPLHQVMMALGVTGMGTGTFISPNNSALMGSAPRHRQGIAAGILATARNFGMVLGVGMAGAIFTTVLAQGGPGSDPSAASALFAAIQASFLATAGVAVLGMLTSAVRSN